MMFAQNVAKLKREYNYTDQTLAEYLGISTSTVKRILNNRRGNNQTYRPSYRIVRAVADKVSLDSDTVFKHTIHFEDI